MDPMKVCSFLWRNFNFSLNFRRQILPLKRARNTHWTRLKFSIILVFKRYSLNHSRKVLWAPKNDISFLLFFTFTSVFNCVTLKVANDLNPNIQNFRGSEEIFDKLSFFRHYLDAGSLSQSSLRFHKIQNWFCSPFGNVFRGIATNQVSTWMFCSLVTDWRVPRMFLRVVPSLQRRHTLSIWNVTWRNWFLCSHWAVAWRDRNLLLQSLLVHVRGKMLFLRVFELPFIGNNFLISPP